MLRIEHDVANSLLSPTIDERHRAAVIQHVDGALRAMPEHLRAGVTMESLAFGAWCSIRRRLSRNDQWALGDQVARWQASRLDVVRQYVRLLHSLVLFAEHELAPSPT